MNLVDDLAKLDSLHQSGALSEEEYLQAKANLLAKSQPVGEKLKQAASEVSVDNRTWGMGIHLAQYCGYIVPGLGFIVPVLLWQMKKDDPEIDRHGRAVANWLITALILTLIFFLLSFVVIGIPLLWALGICGLLFPAIGAFKAYNGDYWDYFFCIEFF
jgi:uncharacterized Tic20 family protein